MGGRATRAGRRRSPRGGSASRGARRPSAAKVFDRRARAVGGGVADLDFVRGIASRDALAAVIGSPAVGDALVDAVWGEVEALQRGGGGGGAAAAGEGAAAPAEGAAVRVRMVALVSS
jgi:hypothetical protein